jgi:hypothetical protein
MKIETCVWIACTTCRAPVIRPLPQGWSYTVKQRPTGIHRVTTHLPQCPDGFKKVEIPDVE